MLPNAAGPAQPTSCLCALRGALRRLKEGESTAPFVDAGSPCGGLSRPALVTELRWSPAGMSAAFRPRRAALVLHLHTDQHILEALKQRKKPPRARGDFLSLARVWVLFRRTLLAFWEVRVLGQVRVEELRSHLRHHIGQEYYFLF